MVLQLSKNKNKLKITALLTLHKCKPYFLSFICKRSQVEGRHMKHNPSCSSSRNEWRATWSSFVRTLVLSCISDKFQIKKWSQNKSSNKPPQKPSGLESSTPKPQEKKEVRDCMPAGGECLFPSLQDLTQYGLESVVVSHFLPLLRLQRSLCGVGPQDAEQASTPAAGFTPHKP